MMHLYAALKTPLELDGWKALLQSLFIVWLRGEGEETGVNKMWASTDLC